VKSINNTESRNSSNGRPLQAARPLMPYEFRLKTVAFQADARKEELPRRLDWPGRPGGLKKPIAQQSEKDQLIDAVRES
jgi:hypothetical protein